MRFRMRNPYGYGRPRPPLGRRGGGGISLFVILGVLFYFMNGGKSIRESRQGPQPNVRPVKAEGSPAARPVQRANKQRPSDARPGEDQLFDDFSDAKPSSSRRAQVSAPPPTPTTKPRALR